MVYETEARFLIAKYGTARAAGGFSTLPNTSVALSGIDTLMIGIGVVLFAFVVFVLVRDMLAARERERLFRREYERPIE